MAVMFPYHALCELQTEWCSIGHPFLIEEVACAWASIMSRVY